jgi:excinuclease ABC subunit A
MERFYRSISSATHHLVYGDIGPSYFVFNDPESACRTCGGLGVDKLTHPELLVPDPERSIAGGCFVPEAFKYGPDTWDGQLIYSLGVTMGFSLDTPWERLPEKARNAVLYGIDPKKITLVIPPDARENRDDRQGKQVGFGGIARRIERHYRRYRQKGEANSYMEDWLDRVMVERLCPDCRGVRLRATRLLFSIGGKSVYDVGQLNFDELHEFLRTVKPAGRSADAGRQVLNEIRGRLELLLGIGLDYLNFNRRSGTLSGGEAQRIRLSTQIGSGLMGMLYVLDEPSIGLHPKDNVKMIATLESLRDIGNTVIVVEHDETTIRAADHIVEMGPGPGIHGGNVVVQGKMKDILKCEASPTGQFLSGKRAIPRPSKRRQGTGQALTVSGARENNLKSINVSFPLGLMIAVTGASGSGKSTLVNEILYKALWKKLIDSRMLPGRHDGLDGAEHVYRVVNIDQTPIGRNSRSNPATYVGFYDTIRDLFAEAPLSIEREYKPGRFSFNVKGGRCEECQGEGVITTQLYFMPDVEVLCGACKGARFNSETLEVTLRGKTIDDVLKMSVEEGINFFRNEPSIGKKIEVLHDLGLGYLTLGQSATTLSGGEAQRVKIATELSKLQRGRHTLYILDEPTTGLHLADVEKLLESLNRLVDAGHTVLLIEHHMDVIKTADHVIDLGPDGGHAGGEVVVTGTPEDVARCKRSHTGRFLKEVLDRSPIAERIKSKVDDLPVASKPAKEAAPREKKQRPAASTAAKGPAAAPIAAAPPLSKRFKASIEQAGSRTIILLPFDPNAVWGQRDRHHVAGSVNTFDIRASLEAAGSKFFFALGPAWRRQNELEAGARVEVELYPEGPQANALALDITEALAAEPEAQVCFDSIATGYRKGLIRWIEGAKRAETRARRIEEMVQMLKRHRKRKTEAV